MATRTDLRGVLGPVGIGASLDAIPTGEVLDFAGAVEALPFGAPWVNGSAGLETAAAVAPGPRESAGPGVANAPGL